MLAHRIRYHCNYAMGKYKVQGVCACVCVCVCASVSVCALVFALDAGSEVEIGLFSM